MKERVTRPHWSYSSISQYQRCSLQYYFERVLHLPRRSASAALVLGARSTAALADYHRRHQAQSGRRRDRAGGVSRPLESAGRRTGHCRYRRKVARRCPGHGGRAGRVLPPRANPGRGPGGRAAVSSADRQLAGRLSRASPPDRPDLITRDADGTLRVGEIKTAGRSFSESDVATSLQPTCYASALHELTGEEPLVEYVVLVKTRVPKVQRIEAVRDARDFGRLGNIIEAVTRAIDAASFYPVESPLNCSGMCVLPRVPGVDRTGEFESDFAREESGTVPDRGGGRMLTELNGKGGNLCLARPVRRDPLSPHRPTHLGGCHHRESLPGARLYQPSVVGCPTCSIQGWGPIDSGVKSFGASRFGSGSTSPATRANFSPLMRARLRSTLC